MNRQVYHVTPVVPEPRNLAKTKTRASWPMPLLPKAISDADLTITEALLVQIVDEAKRRKGKVTYHNVQFQRNVGVRLQVKLEKTIAEIKALQQKRVLKGTLWDLSVRDPKAWLVAKTSAPIETGQMAQKGKQDETDADSRGNSSADSRVGLPDIPADPEDDEGPTDQDLCDGGD